MWPEPLTADTVVLTKYSVLIRTHAGAGAVVARVLAVYNPEARYAVFGEMQIVDQAGGPKQRVRALALLVREALRYADSIGITAAHTPVPAGRPALLAFARRMSGKPGEPDANNIDVRIGGALYEMRTAALAATDADGNLTGDPIANL